MCKIMLYGVSSSYCLVRRKAGEATVALNLLIEEAGRFAQLESEHFDPSIYGITDGKAIGTYFEHKFQKYLSEKYAYECGNSASGIDFPDLGVDMKVTRLTQPQSSCPFRSARQKIYGLGYSLLVFVYDKVDDLETKMGNLNIVNTIFVAESRTADFQTTDSFVFVQRVSHLTRCLCYQSGGTPCANGF